MPSKGNKVIPARLPRDLVRAMCATIRHRNLWSPAEPWKVSDFVRIAIREKIAKMRRSAGKRRTRRDGPSTEAQLDTQARIASPTAGDAREGGPTDDA